MRCHASPVMAAALFARKKNLSCAQIAEATVTTTGNLNMPILTVIPTSTAVEEQVAFVRNHLTRLHSVAVPKVKSRTEFDAYHHLAEAINELAETERLLKVEAQGDSLR